MSGIARFHDKLHRSNHHTAATPGLPDSSYDPIASPEKPFRGDFILSGSLSSRNEVKSSSFETSSAKITNRLVLSGTSGGVLANSNTNNAIVNNSNSLSINYDGGVYLKNNLILNNGNLSLSAGVLSAKLPGGVHTDKLSDAYNILSINSGDWETAAGLVGLGPIEADVELNGNLVVRGNLSALGSTTLINVTATTTDALCVFNADPTRPALDITQVTGTRAGVVLKHLGTGNILSAVGSVGGTNFVISSAGYVGIGTSNPRAELQILSGLLALDGIKEAPPLLASYVPASAVSGAYIYFGNLGDEWPTTKGVSNDYAMLRQIGESPDTYHLTLDLYNNVLGTLGQKFSIRNNNPSTTPTPLFHINEYGNIGINTNQQENTAQLYIDATGTTKPCIAAFGRRSPFVFYHYSTAKDNNAYSVSKYYSASGTGTNPVCALAGVGHSFRIIPYVQGTDSLGAITGEWANDDGTGAADITMGYEVRPTISDLRGYISFSTADGSAEGSSNPCEERIRITSTGKVGVGTSLPNKQLTILGDISATGDMVIDNYQPLKQGSFVTSLTQLAALTSGNRKYDQAEIFNNWYRYSHTSVSLSDVVSTNETNSWELTSVGGFNYIRSKINTATNVGFVSEANYKKYVHEVRFFSLADDDDDNGLVLARYIDPTNGDTHTLTLVRSIGNPQDLLFECILAEPGTYFSSAPSTVQKLVRYGGNASNPLEHLSARGIQIGDKFIGSQNTGAPSVPSNLPTTSSEYKSLLLFQSSLSNNFRLNIFNRFFRAHDDNTTTPKNPEGYVYLPALCSLSASSGRLATEPLTSGALYPYTATTTPGYIDFAIVYNQQHKSRTSVYDSFQGISTDNQIIVAYNIKDIKHYDYGWNRACNSNYTSPTVDAAGGVKIKAIRDNNIIKCETSDFFTNKDDTNATAYVASISCDLSDSSKPYLSKFNTQLPYGYFNWSQPSTYFEILKFVDTFDVQYSGDTYTYDPDNDKWVVSTVPFSPETDFATGKFSRDHYTAQTYYVQNANTILPISKWYSSINEDQRNQKVSIDNQLTLVTTTTAHPVSSFTITPSAVATASTVNVDYLVCYVNGKKRYIPLYY